MVRARLMAAAALLAALAVPGAASAQFSPCNLIGSPLPPPCIVMDFEKIAQEASELQSKTQELQQLASKAKEMTSLQTAMGVVSAKTQSPLGGLAPIAPIAATSTGAARDAFTGSIPATDGSPTSNDARAGAARVALRGTAGDGWAISEIAKTRLADLQLKARTIQAVAICSARRNAPDAADDNLRNDWQVNTRAKSLVAQAMVSLREVTAQRLQLRSVKAFSDPGVLRAPSTTTTQQAAAAPASATVQDWSSTLAQVANLSNQLSALLTAKSVLSSFQQSAAGQRDTQTDYQQTLAAARASDAQFQSAAASEASRRRVSVAALTSIANAYMGQDRTSWDDPAKGAVQSRLANAAAAQMSRVGRGSVSQSFVNAMVARADAFNEEAFFRPVAQQAQATETDAVASMKAYATSIGLTAADPASVDAAIARTQAALAAAGKSMDGAPADVIAQRNAIYSSTVDPATQSAAAMAQMDASTPSSAYAPSTGAPVDYGAPAQYQPTTPTPVQPAPRGPVVSGRGISTLGSDRNVQQQ